MLDVAIVGAGPAGLNAALLLARCRRSVVVCDAGSPRNARSRGVGGFLTRDGTDPMELRRLAEAEVGRYPGVGWREGKVLAARRDGEAFEIQLADGERVKSRKLLLATGLLNDVPDFPDARAFFGRGVYPCPYCDGFEHRDEPLIAYGEGRPGRGMAIELLAWSRDIVLVTGAPGGLSPEDADELAGLGIEVVADRIARLEGDPDGDGLERVHLAGGRVLARRALFYAFDECRQSPLVAELGCDMSDKGAVETGACERTNVPGLYVAGDASKRVKFAVVAAAEGAMAAFAINVDLLKEDAAALARGRSAGR